MLDRTRKLWDKQFTSVGDRSELFGAVADLIDANDVLYPGSYVDLTPSYVWPAVTYVDVDRRANQFFADTDGVAELVAEHGGQRGGAGRSVRFIHADYSDRLDLGDDSFDLLISLYAGFISEHCTRYLRPGGHLLVNSSHGDAAMASIDERYDLAAVVVSRNGHYRTSTANLDSYLIPKRDVEITKDSLHASGRGVAYTKSPFAYLFRRAS